MLIARGSVNVSGEGREARGREGGEARPHCANHDDGSTAAVVDCRTCGPLCAECDRFLHLNRAARTHHRQVIPTFNLPDVRLPP